MAIIPLAQEEVGKCVAFGAMSIIPFAQRGKWGVSG